MSRPSDPTADESRPAARTAGETGVVGPLIDDLLERCHFPVPETVVVCGVSGGADSLALLALAAAAGLRVTAVHVDHGLRPGSAGEAGRVAAAARRFDAAFETVLVDVADGPNLEARARAARHRALGPGALLGHTADDQAETVLINLARGAGPGGLAAMRPGGSHPILRLRRSETERLCESLGLEPFDDPSNDDPRFVRNRVRNELLPLLADIAERDPVPLLTRTADHARSLVDGVNELASDLDPADAAALRAAPPVVARAALRQWLRSSDGHPLPSAALDRAWQVVEHRVRACELPGGRRLSRTKGRLSVAGPAAPDVATPGDSSSESADGSVA